MTAIKIETGVPFPKYAKTEDIQEFPVKKLKVGQSFVIPTPADKVHLNRVRAKVHYLKSKLELEDAKFTIAKDPGNKYPH